MDNDKYKQLKEVATERGRNGASNQFDGNTPTEVYEDLWKWFTGQDDPIWIDDLIPNPLSGEWAGESIPELFYGLVDNPSDPTDEEMDLYHSTYMDAYYTEIERWVRYMLNIEDLDAVGAEG